MNRRLLTISLLLLTCSLLAGAGEPAARDVVSDPILMATLRYLDTGFRAAGPIRTHQLLQQVTATTRRSETQIRAHLLVRLQDLVALRKDDPGAWETLLARQGTLSDRQVTRLIDHLTRGLRSILTSSDDYLLDTNLRWAAREARIPAAEALAFLGRLVSHQLADDPLVAEADPIGLVVNGWTEKYDYRLEPLYIYLDTQDEAVAREAVRDIQRFIVPGVVRGLPATPGVAWAFRQRDLTALVDPTYDIRLRVRSLRFKGLTTNLQPCIDIGLDVLDTKTGRSVFFEDIEHCTQLDAITTEHRLSPFFDEVATVVVDVLARNLSTLR